MHSIEESAHVAEPCVEGAGGSAGALDDCFEGECGASTLVKYLLSGVDHAFHRLDASLLYGCATSHGPLPPRAMLCFDSILR
ncbi:unannotated protein [freshwater metagenome]|uniref:Unannotated protein n=1 Tax=freshwater metagenome TaxID=449393 RepID=A0A6J7PSY0_9ZZZZ